MMENNTSTGEEQARQTGIRGSLGSIWSFLTKPNAAIRDIEHQRQAQLLAGLTFFLTLSVLSGLIASLMNSGSSQEKSSTLAFLFAIALTFVSYLFSRSRHFGIGTVLLLSALSCISYVGAIIGDTDPLGFALSFLPLAFIIGGVLLSLRGIVILTVSNVILVVVLAILMRMPAGFAGPVSGLVIGYGIMLYIFTSFRNSLEQARLAETNKMNQKLQTLSTSLEQRVGERTNDMLVAAEVGQRISTIQNQQELLHQSVELIRERFDLYYVQVYLVSLNGNSLLMVAGTGTVGVEFQQNSHRLPIDYTSINGAAAEDKRPITVVDTQNSRIFRPHALLPNTRSEMSIPLISGGRLLGVLDLQSSEVGGLSEKNLPVFQVLAGQLATALVNAELFERIENTLAEAETRNSQKVRQGWDEYLDAVHVKERIGYTFDQMKVEKSEGPLVEEPDTWTLSTPIAVAGEPVGLLQFVGERPWAPEYAELVSSVAAQAAQQLENLRLLNQAELYRSEAEEAVRRLTRQEWGTFLPAAGTGGAGFIYADDEVQPLAEDHVAGTALKFDVKVRDEKIGYFGFDEIEGIAPEDAELVEAVSEQLGAHLENIRLYTAAEQELEERRKAEAIIAKRATELTTVSEVATVVATIQSPEEMLQTVVDLTKVSFDLYHAHIYLMNEAGTMLVLTKGAGDVGRQMVTEGRQIPHQAEKSLVARAARSRQGVVANDVRQDPDFLPHPLLPDTRSEMAVPLIVGENLLGVLDIQSTEANRFSDEDISIHSTLASQVAVALQNARQYAQTQESEQLTRTVIDSTPDWIFIKDQQHLFRLANQGYLTSLHLEMEDIIGKNDIDLGFPEELVKGDPEKGIAGFWADDRAVMDSGVPKIVPRDIVMIDGKERILNTLKTPLRDASGNVWGVLAFCRDVTEREQSLADAEALYEGSRQLARSQTNRDVLEAVVQHTVLSHFDGVSLSMFDRPWEEMPQTITILAVTAREGAFMPFREGMVLPAQSFTKFYRDPQIHAMIIENITTDQSLPEDVRYMMANEQGVQANILWPLVIGGQTLGMVSATSSHPVDVNESERRRLGSLLEQASTVVQSLRLFEAAQSRAHREQVLREITARVRSSMDPDTILRTAVRELGAALGRPAFVRVGSADQLMQKAREAEQDVRSGDGDSQAIGEGGM